MATYSTHLARVSHKVGCHHYIAASIDLVAWGIAGGVAWWHQHPDPACRRTPPPSPATGRGWRWNNPATTLRFVSQRPPPVNGAKRKKHRLHCDTWRLNDRPAREQRSRRGAGRANGREAIGSRSVICQSHWPSGMASGCHGSPSPGCSHRIPIRRYGFHPGEGGVRGLERAAGSLRSLACWPFQDPRTLPGFAETPVFASFGARLCSARDLSVFHSLDTPPMRPQGRGVRKRPSDRLRRKPSWGPLSPLVGDTY